MKFIHLGDLHIGRTFDMRPMLEDQRHVLKQVLDLAKERQPDLVIIAGDIYDRSVPREEAVALYDEFITSLVHGLGIPVYAISGNHDSARRLEGMGSLLRQVGYHVAGTLKNPLESIGLSDAYGPVDLYFMPFKDMNSARALFDLKDVKNHTEVVDRILQPAADNPNRKILIAHNYFSLAGQKLEESESERNVIGGTDVIDSSVFVPFDYVALGHLHKAQKVGRDSVRYSGSLLKYSTSEADHRKVITWVEMDGAGETKIELVPLKLLRDLCQVRGSMADFMRSDFIAQKDDFLSIILSDEDRIDQAFQILSRLYPNIVSLTYDSLIQDYELNVDREAIRKADSRKLFMDFFKDKNLRAMNQAELDFMEDIFQKMEVDHGTDPA